MDMNELLRQHQIALINAQYNGAEARASNYCLARHYEKRITALRIQLGVLPVSETD